jgi:hypothetical protein
MNRGETAAYIGYSATWFTEKLPELYALGFPRPLPVLDKWDRHAVDRWLDRLGGEAPRSEADEIDAWARAAGG